SERDAHAPSRHEHTGKRAIRMRPCRARSAAAPGSRGAPIRRRELVPTVTMSPLLRPAFAMPEAALERARRVRLLLLDVDGVLTDGRVILGPADEYKAFDIKDGHGIRLLIENGITIGIVTGRTSRAVERRAAELGVRHLYQGCGEKLPVCAALVRELGLAREQAAYVGDDVVDLPVMLHLGLG